MCCLLQGLQSKHHSMWWLRCMATVHRKCALLSFWRSVSPVVRSTESGVKNDWTSQLLRAQFSCSWLHRARHLHSDSLSYYPTWSLMAHMLKYRIYTLSVQYVLCQYSRTCHRCWRLEAAVIRTLARQQVVTCVPARRRSAVCMLIWTSATVPPVGEPLKVNHIVWHWCNL